MASQPQRQRGKLENRIQEDNAMPVYSHTQLSTFQQCPLRYRFLYVDRLRKPEETSAEAFVGSRVHETLQKLYEDLKYGKLNTLEGLLAYYRDQWLRNLGIGFRIVREGITGDHYQEYGRRCIQNYYGRHHPFDQSVTLKTEFHLLFALDSEGRYKMQGYIDRLAKRPDGVYEIHDYKTSANLPSQSQVDADRQLALYQIGLASRWNDVERVELIWHYVSFDSTLVSYRSPEQLEQLSRETAVLIDEIEHCQSFPPVKSALCEWCEYRPECPVWKHVIAVQAATPEEIEADEGAQLANEYGRIKLEMDALAGRLEEIRNRILEYARQHAVSTLQGNGLQVSVKSREQFSLPGRDEEEWLELEEYVKSEKRWEEVSDLSTKKLEQVLGCKNWPQESLDRLRSFLRLRPITTLRVTRTDLPPRADASPNPDESEPDG
jgi:putative RecB family exonuclease